MPSRKFTRQQLQDILWENYGGEVLVNDATDQSRWSVNYRLVFKAEDDGKGSDLHVRGVTLLERGAPGTPTTVAAEHYL